MPKKSNTRRADGRIAVQVYLGMVEGKRKYKTVYGKTQKEAESKADEVRSQLHKGIDITAQNETFGTWVDLWLSGKKLDVSDSQYKSYIGYTNHLKNYFGKAKISKITTANIQALINELAVVNPHTKKPTAKKTLNDIKITASQIFSFAIKNKVILSNPATEVSIPQKSPQEHRRALTAEEQSWITNTPHDMQCPAMIMMYAGLRRGELIPLKWSDIDLKNKTISINKSVEMKAGHPEVKPSAKTDSGLRTIDLPNVLVKFLEALPKANVLVCPAKNDAMYSAQAWKRSWNSYLLDIDVLYGKTPQKKSKYDPRFRGITIPRFTAHWLRHTYATLLYFAGVDILTAKEQLGHSDIQTTLKIYTHLDAQYKRKSMDKFDAYLDEEKKKATKA